MEIAERARRDEIHGCGVIGFGFAGEAGDDVGTDGGVRQLFTDEVDAARVVFAAVPAVHGGEDLIGGGLQRHMKVFGESRGGGEERDHVAGDVERLDGTEAKAGDGSFVEDLAEEIEKILAGRKVAAPSAEVDAAQDDFLVAGFGETSNFAENDFWREAAAFSADERDDAEGTAVVAAVLDF